MKKIILSGIIIFMILTISHASFAVTATVNVTAVRIRESASTQARSEERRVGKECGS